MLRLYRKPSKGLIGVDISSTSVKVLALSVKNNRYWVESYALVPLPEGSVVEKNRWCFKKYAGVKQIRY